MHTRNYLGHLPFKVWIRWEWRVPCIDTLTEPKQAIKLPTLNLEFSLPRGCQREPAQLQASHVSHFKLVSVADGKHSAQFSALDGIIFIFHVGSALWIKALNKVPIRQSYRTASPPSLSRTADLKIISFSRISRQRQFRHPALRVKWTPTSSHLVAENATRVP